MLSPNAGKCRLKKTTKIELFSQCNIEREINIYSATDPKILLSNHTMLFNCSGKQISSMSPVLEFIKCFKYFELNNPFNLFFSKKKVKSLENEINEIIQQHKCHQYGYPQLETFRDTRNFGKPWYKCFFARHEEVYFGKHLLSSLYIF